MASDRSLDAEYFDGIFASDDDPWALASSAYEAAKFAHTIRVLDDRRYSAALEIGCAHGVLTQRLAPLCDDLCSVDIAAGAIALAQARCGDLPQVRFARVAFPGERPAVGALDLVLLSEVAYYWSDADLRIAADWIGRHVASGGRILLVHWTGETDYPQTGDAATETLREALGDAVVVERADRAEGYRLDLWHRP